MSNYDVIIIGGGPTGVALGIELGLNHIKTLILEKYPTPLLSPRAQSLNARSMEFFLRWKLANALKAKQLLPPDFPIRGVWCSKLNGKTYAVSSSNEQLNDTISPERGVRIPLWLTEEVLRNKLSELPSVTLLKNHSAFEVVAENQFIRVTTQSQENKINEFYASFVVGCDGANSITRQQANIHFENLSPAQRVINVVFESQELAKLITVEKGFLFYLLDSSKPGAIGPVDLTRGLWYAQIRDDEKAQSIEEINLDQLLFDMTGLQFDKKIIQAHFWNMQIQLADRFAKDNKIFLVGDSAHGFVPTGGFGLNTGLGDAVNLGWKLASVIKGQAKVELLSTYEKERRPVCLFNLKAAQKNADDMIALRGKFDPKKDPEGFAAANAALAKQHTHSLGATMGYAYFDSPLTMLNPDQSTKSIDPTNYEPKPYPGFFLPHIRIQDQSIYSMLSPIHWTFLISDHASLPEEIKQRLASLDVEILTLPKNAYSFSYILIRPDWHIVFASNTLSNISFDFLFFLDQSHANSG